MFFLSAGLPHPLIHSGTPALETFDRVESRLSDLAELAKGFESGSLRASRGGAHSGVGTGDGSMAFIPSRRMEENGKEEEGAGSFFGEVVGARKLLGRARVGKHEVGPSQP